MSKKILLHYAAPAIITGMLFATVAVSWEEPLNNPPDGNVSAPINVSADNQSKEGWLTIGNTLAPSMQLDVQGIAPLLGSLNVAGGAILNKGGAEDGLIVANGNVGIGVTDPQAGLHVREDDLGIDWGLAPAQLTAGNIKVEGENSRISLIGRDFSDWSSYLKMSEVNGSGGYLNSWYIWRGTTSFNDGKFAISYGDGAESFLADGSTKFTILPNGNVGIGTSDPKQKLEVDGGIRLNTADVRPACDLDARGTFWLIQGAAGVKDSVAVCAKDAADAYAWRSIW